MHSQELAFNRREKTNGYPIYEEEVTTDTSKLPFPYRVILLTRIKKSCQ